MWTYHSVTSIETSCVESYERFWLLRSISKCQLGYDWRYAMLWNQVCSGSLKARVTWAPTQLIKNTIFSRIYYWSIQNLRQSAQNHQGACNGDSGGPLQCFIHGKWYFSGIVSFGASGCDTNIASIYGKVYHEDINGFIESIIEDNSWIN